MEGLSQELNIRTGKLPFFSSPVVYDPALARMFNTAHALYEQGRSFLRAHSILLLAFSEAICKYSDEARELPKVGREETAVFRAKQFIHENYLREITLNEIAGVSGLSTFHFLRCFRQATGIPPFAFVMNLRIEKAKELLRNGWKIVDVAAATGFYDQSHLTNYFKSIVSVTPRHYRTAHLGKKRMGPSGQ